MRRRLCSPPTQIARQGCSSSCLGFVDATLFNLRSDRCVEELVGVGDVVHCEISEPVEKAPLSLDKPEARIQVSNATVEPQRDAGAPVALASLVPPTPEKKTGEG